MDTIKVKLNETGRAIIKLYGTDFDVTDLADKDGKGELTAFGDEYHFVIVNKKTSKTKLAKKVEVANE